MTSPAGPLSGRVALVTGANAGIGRAIALALHAAGARLALHHLGDADGIATASHATGGAPVYEADFTTPDSARALAAHVLADNGRVDILISNAAIERRINWAEATSSHMAAHFLANCMSPVSLSQLLVPDMARAGWGRIVAIGSVMAERPRAETFAYAAAKSAQKTALRAIARDVARHGVTMNIISPGAIEVEKNAHRYAQQDFRAAVLAKIPAARAGRPDDIAGLALFLCSDAASYITGADIPVDGGWTIGDPPGLLPGEVA